MFQTAHHSIAVANAIDELKQYATEVTISNEDDGVVKYIESDWMRRKDLQ
jgi:hydroxymethylpyrimidine pyrophosphatase-like HAD family hydrolase